MCDVLQSWDGFVTRRSGTHRVALGTQCLVLLDELVDLVLQCLRTCDEQTRARLDVDARHDSDGEFL